MGIWNSKPLPSIKPTPNPHKHPTYHPTVEPMPLNPPKASNDNRDNNKRSPTQKNPPPKMKPIPPHNKITNKPSLGPTLLPSIYPSSYPSIAPSSYPTSQPSIMPTTASNDDIPTVFALTTLFIVWIITCVCVIFYICYRRSNLEIQWVISTIRDYLHRGYDWIITTHSQEEEASILTNQSTHSSHGNNNQYFSNNNSYQSQAYEISEYSSNYENEELRRMEIWNQFYQYLNNNNNTQ